MPGFQQPTSAASLPPPSIPVLPQGGGITVPAGTFMQLCSASENPPAKTFSVVLEMAGHKALFSPEKKQKQKNAINASEYFGYIIN